MIIVVHHQSVDMTELQLSWRIYAFLVKLIAAEHKRYQLLFQAVGECQ